MCNEFENDTSYSHESKNRTETKAEQQKHLKIKAMKTKNNVQKTAKQLALAMAIVSMSLTTLEATAATGKSSLASKSKKMMFTTLLQEATETALPLEPWMFSSTYFAAPQAGMEKLPSAASLAGYTETEKTASIEKWMTDDTLWKIKK